MRALCLLLLAAPLLAQDLPEVRTDHLGRHRRSRCFREVVERGARIFDDRTEGSFLVEWVPSRWDQGRVLVALHGTGGSPYEEVKDEIPLAREFGYAVVAVHWFDEDERRFFDAPKLHRVVERALASFRTRHPTDLSRVALCGFSRGGAVSYEMAWLDRQGEKRFDLVIAHSGGIPLDLVVAPGEGRREDAFFADLMTGRLGEDALAGTRFFLYSGDRDEEWGVEMSRQMEHAERLIESSGGEVVERIRDPEGSHMGYRKDREVAEKAIRHFLRLTP